MLWLAIFILYGLVGLVTARRAAWHIYSGEYCDGLEGLGGIDWGALAFAIPGGVIVGAVWPLSAVFLFGRSAIDRRGEMFLSLFLAPPRSVKERQRRERLEREAQAREAYITKLERELGV
jgi:hypothetical protein